MFSKYFEQSYNLRNHATQATHNFVKIYQMDTQLYGYNSVKDKSVSSWNHTVSKIKTEVITESNINIKR